MTFSRAHSFVITAVALAGAMVHAAPDWKAVEPMLKEKCYSCHGGEKTKGEIDLARLSGDPDLVAEFALWERVKHSIESGDMPPPKAKPLSKEEGTAITGWVQHELEALAAAKSGDPGQITMCRLTNAEYDYSIRDLTGRYYGLAKEFQTDGGGGEGFSNTGDVLFMSPSSLDKYFAAARKLADHATIMPGTAIVFHDHRVGLRGPEQLKAQAEQGLYVWYQQKSGPHLPKDFEDMREADYMLACWKHKHLNQPLDKLAKDAGLKLPFLENWWRIVTRPEPKSRYLDLTRVAWRELPMPDPAKPGQVPQSVVDGTKAIQAQLLSWNNPNKPGSGVQRQQQDADGIRPYGLRLDVHEKASAFLCIGDTGDGNKGDVAIISKITLRTKKGWLKFEEWVPRQLDQDRKTLSANPPPANAEALKKRVALLEKAKGMLGKHPQGRQIEPQQMAFSAPLAVELPLPDQCVEIRAEARLDMKNPEVDEATLQWTFALDKPRDVTKIMPGVLTIWKRSTPAASRTMGDFNVMKTAFPDMYERRLEMVADNLYSKKPGITVYYFSDEQLSTVLSEEDRRQLQRMKMDWGYCAPKQLNPQQQKEWDDLVVGHLKYFAMRAWRRPLSGEESTKLTSLYFDGRAKELDRESAAREVLVRVLVSPHFLFKAETLPALTNGSPASAPNAGGDLPLSAWEVASRLSYFLWASLPDTELRKTAEDGSILKREVLIAQTKRMLRNSKADALAKEFAGQWLKFNGFDAHDGVDQKLFPEFTPELRADMLQEAVAFFSHLVREDRNVGDIIAGDYSFLNERLAKHYGVPGVSGGQFREVKLTQQHRGGLLGMGAILTKTSRPHRTTPVLRGDYLYHVVLGQSSPPPPPNVPQLNESGLKPSNLREALKQHSADKACSVCHDRIDPYGFALEGFDPIGRFRLVDAGGGKIDDTAVTKDGTTLQGIEGLRSYLMKNDSQFKAQLCRKLLGYALGRQTLLSDRALLAKMQESLKNNGGQFSAAVLEVVTSRQFLNRRDETAVAGNP